MDVVEKKLSPEIHSVYTAFDLVSRLAGPSPQARDSSLAHPQLTISWAQGRFTSVCPRAVSENYRIQDLAH